MVLSYLLITILLMDYFYKIKSFKSSNNRSSRPEVFLLLRGVLRKSCSENMQHIYKGTPRSKRDFNKVSRHLDWSHTLVWVFSCKFLEQLFLRTSLAGCFCNNILLFSKIFHFKSVILTPIYIVSLCIFYFTNVFETGTEFR